MTLQTYLDGAWHDAALIEIKDPARGHQSPTVIDYITPYYFNYGSGALEAGRPVVDAHALSVCYPLDLEPQRRSSWPPFLLDILPQGDARSRLARALQLDPDALQSELPLLLRGGGSPIGNVRVKEAWTAEVERLRGSRPQGLTREDLLTRSPAFQDMIDTFALLVSSGSSGPQGEWPKVLFTQARDGLWYPDSSVLDEEAVAHVIVKMSRAAFAEDRVILAAEAPYLEVARAFGLRVGGALEYKNDVLLVPRFDRRSRPDRPRPVERLGQESLVAASGVAAFGHVTTHERYLETILCCCTDPKTEIVEYVLRDLLNRVMGDTDNHGRNTALQKRSDGWIGLTPRFDFAPMSLLPDRVQPPTSWGCLRGRPGGARYALICQSIEEVTADQTIAAAVRAALIGKAEEVAALPALCQRLGVPDEALSLPRRNAAAEAEALRALARAA